MPPSLEDVFLDVVGAERGVTGCWKAIARSRARNCARSVRDRRTLLILLFVPAFFLLVYGYALNFDIRHVRLAVQDRDRSGGQPALISAS